MDRRTRNVFALALILVVAITGGAVLLLSDPSRPVPGGPPVSRFVQGVIVAVDSEGLADVRGFTLRRPGGETVEFGLGELENGNQFPPGHLAEHQATADPVRVYYREEGDQFFAIRIEDAGA